MCRWLAYAGAPITLDTLLTRPDHSLIDQSWLARQLYLHGSPETAQFREHDLPTNGDGFGVGWYGCRDFPGQYRDVRPAWNDANLHRLCEQIESPMFLAHVRAAIGGDVSRANCHPFRHGKWLFLHNGGIGGFSAMKRDLTFAVAPELYPGIEGNGDTEVMFHLALTYGLEDDPLPAIAKMVGRIEQARAEHGVQAQFRGTMCAADGEKLYVVRYSSKIDEYVESPTLYYSTGDEQLRTHDGGAEKLPGTAHIVASEPLELHYSPRHWVEVPDWSSLVVEAGKDVVVADFAPEPVEALPASE